jgi:hypothetical protein
MPKSLGKLDIFDFRGTLLRQIGRIFRRQTVTCHVGYCLDVRRSVSVGVLLQTRLARQVYRKGPQPVAAFVVLTCHGG